MNDQYLETTPNELRIVLRYLTCRRKQVLTAGNNGMNDLQARILESINREIDYVRSQLNIDDHRSDTARANAVNEANRQMEANMRPAFPAGVKVED